MAKSRKRTGKNKRLQRNRMGPPAPPDENKVRSAQTATTYFKELGRSELATGYTVRVAIPFDVTAWPAIESNCHKYGKLLAERSLSPFMVAGMAPIVKQLDEIDSMAHASEELDPSPEPSELVVASAAKFVGARRKAIARMAKGEKNRALRHAFGINQPMRAISLEEVREGLVSLLAGRQAHADSPVAKLITAGDVSKAKDYVTRLNDLRVRNGARKSSSAELARTRDVLHCALELFYDRFGAAVDVALEDDDAARVALLSLIPRRKERRVQAKSPVAPAAETA